MSTFDQARDTLALKGEYVISTLFPGGEWRDGEYWITNPLRADKKPGSFSISATGLYKDFSSDHSGDFIDLITQVQGIPKKDAAQLIVETGGNGHTTTDKKKKDKPEPVLPIPADVLKTFKNHARSKFIKSRYGEPVKAWQYNDQDGQPWCIVARHEKDGEKNHVPYYYGQDQKWHAGCPVKEKRSIFNAEKIKPGDKVLVVEGEKCASVQVPGYVVVSWLGGTGQVKKTDFTPLKDHDVTIWPDADEPGLKAALAIKGIIPDAKILNIQDKSKGWDIADAENEGIELETFITDCGTLQDEITGPGQELIEPSVVSLGMTRPEMMKSILSQSLDFRYNIVNGRYEFKRKKDRYYVEFTDRHFNSIRMLLMQHYIKTVPESELRMVIESDFTPEYCPIQEYFSLLDPWDGKDHIRTLADLVKVTPWQYGANVDAQDVWSVYLLRWLIASVATMQQHYENHTCLTLLGSQGIGKTTFLRRLGINPELVYVGAINPADKDSKINYAEKTLIVLDELEATTRHEMAGIKSNLTLDKIKLRRPYGRREETLPRRASFCASANDIHVLGDLTGSRRFLCVEIDDVDYLGVTPELMAKCYAQAEAALNAGVQYWFNQDDIKMMNERNDRFYMACPEEEALFQVIHHPDDIPAVHHVTVLTNTEIIKRMSDNFPSIRFGSKKLGQIMKKYGYERKARSSDRLYGYEVVEK